MEAEIVRLQELLRLKDSELDFLTEEKSGMKQLFINEGNLMKNDLVVLQNEYKQTQLRHQE
jgi:hypothetical protein